MSKSKEELNSLKEEVETLNNKLAELNEEELEQVFGGVDGKSRFIFRFREDSQQAPEDTVVDYYHRPIKRN